MEITRETQREAHEFISHRRDVRSEQILEVLGDRQLTVSEIVVELLDRGVIKYYDRNFVAPRLTELKDAGIVKVVGKRPCIMSGKNVAVWAREDNQ